MYKAAPTALRVEAIPGAIALVFVTVLPALFAAPGVLLGRGALVGGAGTAALILAIVARSEAMFPLLIPAAIYLYVAARDGLHRRPRLIATVATCCATVAVAWGLLSATNDPRCWTVQGDGTVRVTASGPAIGSGSGGASVVESGCVLDIVSSYEGVLAVVVGVAGLVGSFLIVLGGTAARMRPRL